MTTGPIAPCLWFDDQAEAAADLYAQTFPNSHVTAVTRYPSSGGNPSGKPPGSVLTVEVEIAGQPFTALNGGPQFVANPSVSFFVQTDSKEEADRIFYALADGGSVLMPLDAYPFSERFGWVQDRFRVSWQVMVGRADDGAMIVPCLMFSDEQKGRAEEAMRHYTGVFSEGRIERVERFSAEEGPEGTVKHGRFRLAGQELIAMDSPIDHGHSFTEAVSLQVICEDQREVDHLWSRLSEGGEEGPCGWLKDRFGLSWQVVPRGVTEWMTSEDEAARDRAFAAMLQMKKLDVAALEAAFRGG